MRKPIFRIDIYRSFLPEVEWYAEVIVDVAPKWGKRVEILLDEISGGTKEEVRAKAERAMAKIKKQFREACDVR